MDGWRNTLIDLRKVLRKITKPKWIRDYLIYQSLPPSVEGNLMDRYQHIENDFLLLKSRTENSVQAIIIAIAVCNDEQEKFTLIQVIQREIAALKSKYDKNQLHYLTHFNPLGELVHSTYKYESKKYVDTIEAVIDRVDKTFISIISKIEIKNVGKIVGHHSWAETPLFEWFKSKEIYDKLIKALVESGFCDLLDGSPRWKRNETEAVNYLDPRKRESMPYQFATFVHIMLEEKNANKFFKFNMKKTNLNRRQIGTTFINHFLPADFEMPFDLFQKNRWKTKELYYLEDLYDFIEKIK